MCYELSPAATTTLSLLCSLALLIPSAPFFSYFYNLIIFYSLLLANYTYLLISIHHSVSETQNEMCFKPYLYRIVITIKIIMKLSHMTS